MSTSSTQFGLYTLQIRENDIVNRLQDIQIQRLSVTMQMNDLLDQTSTQDAESSIDSSTRASISLAQLRTMESSLESQQNQLESELEQINAQQESWQEYNTSPLFFIALLGKIHGNPMLLPKQSSLPGTASPFLASVRHLLLPEVRI